MRTTLADMSRITCLVLCAAILAACGGGGSSSSSVPSNALLPEPDLTRASQTSPYAIGCNNDPAAGSVTENTAVEPYEAVNPANPANVIGIWQQDRWTEGGAHGLVAAYSMDGAKTWKEQTLPLSACGGGSYERASDPWVSFSPNGTAYLVSISFSGNSTLSPRGTGSGGVLVMRSTDGGATWGTPTSLIADGNDAFDDKESVTADPNDSHYAYVVWDRLDDNGFGPAYISLTADGGNTWSQRQAVYDPGLNNQTIGNEIIGLTDGSIVDLFEEIDNSQTANIRVSRSTDHGTTWSAPVTVAGDLAVGAFDPHTHVFLRTGAGLPAGAAIPGGGLVVVWEDSSFSGGLYDGIALSESTDAGQTWSAPVEVNRDPAVQAFTPSVAVLADGTIGVTYYDFRNNSSNASTLLTDYWFASSSDAVHWSEQHISGPFDMDLAPEAGGHFIGDYQALAVVGNVFTPFFVQTNPAGSFDRTDAYALPPQPVPLTLTRRVTHLSIAKPPVPMGSAFRTRVRHNVEQLMRNENPRLDRPREGAPGASPP